MPSEHSDGILNSGIIKSIFFPSDNYSGLTKIRTRRRSRRQYK
ncbi:TPA: hypothetical protein ACFOVJ_001262 [Neisseria meningitidis]|uniref:Uncharacterized protein n=1 Tax=Neisseria flavescens NRL30031/H210 TaxID=546264 RepID=C0ENU8_NEIFL|nr:hypothetical protein [Neisseria meningitidis]EEG33296.1 hypothetical protein NEIFLAOT_01635 [Neisseria flavescens NRL30031/H210]MCV6719017.1 hypothetical protein [Neisseria meningitidis]MCV6721072.1 hypothetical protein [Neisseria meningitidis]MCV6722460.1 hypothetical protein [Neisseria meningitidis]MCV6724974.1 hypothetical protein [Neisseria meningitidis]